MAENQGKNLMLDICDLHSAGELNDDQLASAAETMAASKSKTLQIGALMAAVSFNEAAEAGSSVAGQVRVLQRLSGPIVELCGTECSFMSWIPLTKAICITKEALLADKLVDGLIAHIRTELRKPPQRPPQRPGDFFLPGDVINYPAVPANAQCPLDALMYPVLKLLLAARLPAAGKLHEALKSELVAAIAEPVPDVPDFSMRAEAEKIGAQHPRLRDFLQSPSQLEMTFNETKMGRMHIHQLIDSRIPGKLTHTSVGYGHGRKLIVRKAHAQRNCMELEHMQQLRDKRRKLLDELTANKEP